MAGSRLLDARSVAFFSPSGAWLDITTQRYMTRRPNAYLSLGYIRKSIQGPKSLEIPAANYSERIIVFYWYLDVHILLSSKSSRALRIVDPIVEIRLQLLECTSTV